MPASVRPRNAERHKTDLILTAKANSPKYSLVTVFLDTDIFQVFPLYNPRVDFKNKTQRLVSKVQLLRFKSS